MITQFVKIIVDGFGAVGKTTMLKSFISRSFDPKTFLTIGVEFFSKEYSVFGHKVIAVFWDFSGAERFKFLRPILYKGASSMILVCDLTRPMTLEGINYFLDTASKQCQINPNQVILVGNKTDLYGERCVTREYIESILQEHQLFKLVETSANSFENLDVIFELSIGIAMRVKRLISDSEFDSFKEELERRIVFPVHEIENYASRQCWSCKRSLDFNGFKMINASLPKEKLIQLWESPYLQFFCCNCYKDTINRKVS